MRFKEAYEGWHAGELTQIEAARLLGMCDRSFRRYLARYEEFDLQGLIDKRIEQVSHRRAPREGLARMLENSLKNFNADPQREFVLERALLYDVLQQAW